MEMVKIVTTMRSEDMWGMYDKFITKMPPVGQHPRYFKFVMLQTKTDKEGKSPEVDRTNVIPCHCVVKTTDPAEKNALQHLYISNLDAKCTDVGCVYGMLQRYRQLCPTDPNKAENAISKYVFIICQ